MKIAQISLEKQHLAFRLGKIIFPIDKVKNRLTIRPHHLQVIFWGVIFPVNQKGAEISIREKMTFRVIILCA